ncbi:hypothetical protein WG66_006417 [Moniliophthora roreri]|uniref:Restriction endonuclease type IV Mrr domain-containing protein n=1 Tax=Moniliophthora roreri TaxID=221103 RepID=A0A0W0EUZ4_MONRR|nr:hypothetical protein WG66_006417 [Moniliophthora roreri]
MFYVGCWRLHNPFSLHGTPLHHTLALGSRQMFTSSPKTATTVYRGTLFERRSLVILEQHLSMSLTRVGGKEDGGIDLIGWWWVPEGVKESDAVDFSRRKRIRVVAQCKAEKKKIGPGYVRELEGVVYRNLDSIFSEDGSQEYGASSNIRQGRKIPVVALFLSESPYTKSALLRAMSSPVPFLLVHIPPLQENADNPDGDTTLGSAVWNAALGGSAGLLQGRMEIRWTRGLSNTGIFGTPTMWYDGQVVPKWTHASNSSLA